LVISHQEFGKWKYPIKINISPPQFPDDTIVIYGHPSSPGVVTFKIQNAIDEDLIFKAYFYKHSINELSVSPESGWLSRLSNNFDLTLKFSPKLTGKTTASLLIIEVSFGIIID
jgi:hypothetical protein